jgi:hypothetical protein
LGIILKYQNMEHKTVDEKRSFRLEARMAFIVKTELEIREAISRGHKCSDDDQFSQARELVHKYRLELGLITENKFII